MLHSFKLLLGISVVPFVLSSKTGLLPHDISDIILGGRSVEGKPPPTHSSQDTARMALETIFAHFPPWFRVYTAPLVCRYFSEKFGALQELVHSKDFFEQFESSGIALPNALVIKFAHLFPADSDRLPGWTMGMPDETARLRRLIFHEKIPLFNSLFRSLPDLLPYGSQLTEALACLLGNVDLHQFMAGIVTLENVKLFQAASGRIQDEPVRDSLWRYFMVQLKSTMQIEHFFVLISLAKGDLERLRELGSSLDTSALSKLYARLLSMDTVESRQAGALLARWTQRRLEQGDYSLELSFLSNCSHILKAGAKVESRGRVIAASLSLLKPPMALRFLNSLDKQLRDRVIIEAINLDKAPFMLSVCLELKRDLTVAFEDWATNDFLVRSFGVAVSSPNSQARKNHAELLPRHCQEDIALQAYHRSYFLEDDPVRRKAALGAAKSLCPFLRDGSDSKDNGKNSQFPKFVLLPPELIDKILPFLPAFEKVFVLSRVCSSFSKKYGFGWAVATDKRLRHVCFRLLVRRRPGEWSPTGHYLPRKNIRWAHFVTGQASLDFLAWLRKTKRLAAVGGVSWAFDLEAALLQQVCSLPSPPFPEDFSRITDSYYFLGRVKHVLSDRGIQSPCLVRDPILAMVATKPMKISIASRRFLLETFLPRPAVVELVQGEIFHGLKVASETKAVLEEIGTLGLVSQILGLMDGAQQAGVVLGCWLEPGEGELGKLIMAKTEADGGGDWARRLTTLQPSPLGMTPSQQLTFLRDLDSRNLQRSFVQQLLCYAGDTHYLTLIEECAQRHPDILEALVRASPHPKWVNAVLIVRHCDPRNASKELDGLRLSKDDVRRFAMAYLCERPLNLSTTRTQSSHAFSATDSSDGKPHARLGHMSGEQLLKAIERWEADHEDFC